MKTIKLLFLVVAFSAVTFYSCADKDSIKTETAAQKSIALRTVLNKLKIENAVGPNRSATVATPPTPLCFEFVFPITFSYNNGTAITASTLNGLLEILHNESPNLFLDGVVFPFHVQYGGAVHTIADEAGLIALIIQCNLPTFNDDLQHSYCFDIVFPIDIATDGQVVTVHSQQELDAYLANPNSGIEAQIVYPISVIDHNHTVIIHNVFEFYDMVNSCNNNTCICTQEYAPVCVHTPNGIIEYSNMCYATCDGYSQNDVVPCNGGLPCEISNLTTTVGSCHPDGTYDLTINFSYHNPPGTSFTIYDSNNSIIGTYPLSSLPLTLLNHTSTGVDNYLTVNFGANSNCTATQQWPTPDCNPTTTYNFGQLLGTCFHILYPVYVQFGGALVTILNDGELLQYWHPTVGPMPTMNYPIQVEFANTPYTFESQAAFETQINISCP